MDASCFQIAIPSYRRTDILRDRTLHLIRSWNVPWNRVSVFCVDDDTEWHTYYIMLQQISPDIQLIRGPLGLSHMRNFIHRHYPDGTPVLHMDDDLRGLSQMVEDTSIADTQKAARYRLVPLSGEQTTQWIVAAFEYTKSIGGLMFGIYPVRNGFFMKDLPPITTNLRFCVGAFWGTWNKSSWQLELEEKEDFERTLLCFEQCGVVIRYNHICPHTHYYHTPGGMQARDIDRVAESKKSCQRLIERFPQWCKLYTGKKSGIYEVRISAPMDFS